MCEKAAFVVTARMDEEIRIKVWQGRVPIQFRFCDNSGARLSHENDIYWMIHRCWYWPMLLSRLRKYYSTIQTIMESSEPFDGTDMDIWVSTDLGAHALPWHQPIGLLYDIYCGSSSASFENSFSPWTLVVHFGEPFPETVARMPSYDSPREHFMSVLKESDYVMHGSAQRVMSLSKSDQTLLWESLCSGNLERYQSSSSKLDTTTIKHIPIKFYIRGQPPLSDLFPVTSHLNDDEPSKLSDALDIIFPNDHEDLMNNNSNNNDSVGRLSVGQVVATDPSPVGSIRDDHGSLDSRQTSSSSIQQQQQQPQQQQPIKHSDREPVLHGVCVPKDVDLVWLHRTMSYPDRFLHITLQ